MARFTGNTVASTSTSHMAHTLRCFLTRKKTVWKRTYIFRVKSQWPKQRKLMSRLWVFVGNALAVRNVLQSYLVLEQQRFSIYYGVGLSAIFPFDCSFFDSMNNFYENKLSPAKLNTTNIRPRVKWFDFVERQGRTVSTVAKDFTPTCLLKPLLFCSDERRVKLIILHIVCSAKASFEIQHENCIFHPTVLSKRQNINKLIRQVFEAIYWA